MFKLFPQASPANQSASSGGVAADPALPVPVPRRLLMWLTYGVAGTILFPIIYLIECATRPGYNAWQQAISTLSLGPGGWIQQANFIMCGASIIWLACVWHQILRGVVCARWYPIVRGIEGVALILVGFSQRECVYSIGRSRYTSQTLPTPIKLIATTSSPPRREARRYQPWHLIASPAERNFTVIRLHGEGWSVTSIANYLQTSRRTVYDTLKHWADEGVASLDAKPKTNKGVHKATLSVRNEIRKLQENPLLGEYSVHTALLRIGITVSPATCGRIMALVE